jgi:hypothetical protein
MHLTSVTIVLSMFTKSLGKILKYEGVLHIIKHTMIISTNQAVANEWICLDELFMRL